MSVLEYYAILAHCLEIDQQAGKEPDLETIDHYIWFEWELYLTYTNPEFQVAVQQENELLAGLTAAGFNVIVLS